MCLAEASDGYSFAVVGAVVAGKYQWMVMMMVSVTIMVVWLR